MNTKVNLAVKKALRGLLPYLFIGFMFYFWYQAYRWENALSENWSSMPELSNLSAITEYFKALVKIIMAGGVFGVLWFLLKNKEPK